MSGCSSDSESVGAVQRNERLLRTIKRMSRKRALVSSDDDDAPRTKRVASPVSEGVSALAGDREKWLGLGRDIRKRKLERMFEDFCRHFGEVRGADGRSVEGERRFGGKLERGEEGAG
ncbi:Hypothetical protein CINCED_3A003162 [Cinara cedri]|uniref:Uncharacterized protein n=1 Tax=Cinara cedri TaxID=506608 RepID=A0A5E4NNY0_9HEMI|nr:Hypothetical protein CINCED_3A003162 [Cinara cedri]